MDSSWAWGKGFTSSWGKSQDKYTQLSEVKTKW
jgi:hypothetical protein